LFEVLLSAIKFEEAYFNASEEEWEKWKEYSPSSATYLDCQLHNLPVQHLQARIGRYK
jgi:hypothetical protein